MKEPTFTKTVDIRPKALMEMSKLALKLIFITPQYNPVMSA